MGQACRRDQIVVEGDTTAAVEEDTLAVLGWMLLAVADHTSLADTAVVALEEHRTGWLVELVVRTTLGLKERRTLQELLGH